MPSPLSFPPSFGSIEEKSASLRVSKVFTLSSQAKSFRRFMADKIMPLSEAVEGYDLFDKMKAQKVIFEA